jgi:tetratricopeptide (TPR) repeat protein
MPIFNVFGKKKRIFDANYHIYMANTYLKDDNLDAAIQEIKKAVDIYPVNGNVDKNKLTPDDREFFICVHFNLGAAYSRKAKTFKKVDPDYNELFALAIAEYKKILDYDPNDKDAAEAYNNIGACEEYLGNLEASIKSRNESLDKNLCYPESYVNLGNSLAEQKKYDEAIQQFDIAINIREDYAEAYYSRALVNANIGRIQEAVSDYGNAIKCKPNYHTAYHNCGCLYSDQGKHKNAIKYFIDALVYSEKNEDMALTHNSIAVSLAKTEKKDLALLHFQEALKFSSDPDFRKKVEANMKLMV